MVEFGKSQLLRSVLHLLSIQFEQILCSALISSDNWNNFCVFAWFKCALYSILSSYLWILNKNSLQIIEHNKGVNS